jgi:hypothetical protein
VGKVDGAPPSPPICWLGLLCCDRILVPSTSLCARPSATAKVPLGVSVPLPPPLLPRHSRKWLTRYPPSLTNLVNPDVPCLVLSPLPSSPPSVPSLRHVCSFCGGGRPCLLLLLFRLQQPQQQSHRVDRSVARNKGRIDRDWFAAAKWALECRPTLTADLAVLKVQSTCRETSHH